MLPWFKAHCYNWWRQPIQDNATSIANSALAELDGKRMGDSFSPGPSTLTKLPRFINAPAGAADVADSSVAGVVKLR